uniref:Uncharacterized protein n=1 Tax=Anguilla anguilla TaxID=7936 RepID=A0A0E9X4L4_ANGAN
MRECCEVLFFFDSRVWKEGSSPVCVLYNQVNRNIALVERSTSSVCTSVDSLVLFVFFLTLYLVCQVLFPSFSVWHPQ